MLQRGATWLADRSRLPGSVRAVCGYYAGQGTFDHRSVLLKRRVDRVVDAMIADVLDDIGDEVAAEFGHESVTLSYDTKLVLPAKLTLGHLYRTLDSRAHARAEGITRLAVTALLDGDMRDARNDEEFADFELDIPLTRAERRRVAEIAQTQLQQRVEGHLARYPDSIAETYEWAVGVSNDHQASDERFRELMVAGQRGETVADRVDTEYRHAAFEDPPDVLTEAERSLPYMKTQYDRVGILYDAMLSMYDDLSLPVGSTFRRAIVLAIVGAQVWLDDVDDFRADVSAGQLTPVTAEYLLAADGENPRAAVVDVAQAYLDRAQAAARAADSTLTGIAIEYIRRSGTPEQLPTEPGAVRHGGHEDR